MANLIKIKRSASTATPGSLAEGELAFSYLSGKLFIGNSSAVIPIGGTHYPGVLTANQALVANSTLGIDKVIVANLNVNEVWANGSAGTAGWILGSSGAGANVYWIDPSTLQTAIGGTNTNIQFNDSGDLGGVAEFTFDKNTNLLTVGNSTVNVAVNTSSVSVGSNVKLSTATLVVGNSTVNAVVNSSALAVGSNVVVDAVGVKIGNSTVNVTANSTHLLVGSNVTLDTTSITVGNSTVNAFINSTAIDVDGNITGHRFLSSNTSLSAPVNGTYDGERLRLYDFGDNRVNYAIGAEASHVWTAVDQNSNTVGFKWYGNTVQVARLGGTGTLELKDNLYVDNTVFANVALSVGNSTVNAYVNSTALVIGTVTVNTSTLFVGNSTTNTTITAGNIALQGTQLTLGANLTLNDNQISVGNSTQNVTINSTAITMSGGMNFGDTTINGWANVIGDFTAHSNVQLGNSFGVDVVTFKATVNTEITPSANNTQKLGRSDLRWGEVNANNVLATNVAVDSVITVGSNVSVSTSQIFVGNSTVNTVINSSSVSTGSLTVANLVVSGDLEIQGNTKLGNATSDVVSFIAQVNTNIVPSANLTYSLGNNSLYWAEVHTGNVHADYGYFNHDVAIYGDLTVSGNLVTTNVQSVVISDPLIYLAGNNYTSDLVDIGFVGNYHTGGANLHTGLFRDASVDEYYLFKGLTQELDGVLTVNTADPSFALADLNAWLQSGALISNALAVTITANSTVNVNITANSLSLTTALDVPSGGTGANTFTVNGILYGNGTGALQVTAAGTDGQVLQANSTGGPVFADLDGGTF